MAHAYLTVERNQQYLLPPDMADWLPADHLAWFILDVVDQFDLSDFERCHRADGRGRAAYDPAMVVAVLLYAYCVGERSSRAIERRCREDVAFRVLAANHAPDHTTIARFLQANESAFDALFTQVLRLCREAGMARVGTLVIDGTKVAANASGAANLSADAIATEVARIRAEAKATDAAEDARYGDAAGDELPAGLADPRSRRSGWSRPRSASTLRRPLVRPRTSSGWPIGPSRRQPRADGYRGASPGLLTPQRRRRPTSPTPTVGP